MSRALEKTIEHWGYLLPYAHIPRSKSDYEKLLDFVEELMQVSRQTKDERVSSLLRLVAKNIEEYENRLFPTKQVSPLEILEFLMEEHSLGQGDLPEIGSQSLVSKILSGERQLTVEHIQQLSKRFGVSSSVFIEGNENYKSIVMR
jgi:HTH-type transcriptional regulator/antitoxin HigA